MESHSTPALPIPRLRLSRTGLAHDTPDPGPSVRRFPTASDVELGHDDHVGDGDDDYQLTPRMTPATILDGADTPAARLRALLSRVPGSLKSPAVPQPRSSPSEIESDFDPPNGTASNTPSIARESIKDLFSRALREPGNTPQKNKPRWRRNSIDASEVDTTPRLQPENGKSKGKRRSLSDDETDSPSSMSKS